MSEIERGRVVGILPTARLIQAVVDRLELAGFDHAQFGILAPEAAVREWRSSQELARDADVPTAALPDLESAGAVEGGILGAGIFTGALLAAAGPILAAGGLGIALVSALAGGGGGALVGALVAHGFHRRHAERLEQELERGGLVLWVLTRNKDQEAEALEALRAAGAKDVHLEPAR